MALYNPHSSPYTVSTRAFRKRFGCKPTDRNIRKRQITESDVKRLNESIQSEKHLHELAIQAAQVDAGVRPMTNADEYTIGKVILEDANRRKRRAATIIGVILILAAIGWIGKLAGFF